MNDLTIISVLTAVLHLEVLLDSSSSSSSSAAASALSHCSTSPAASDPRG
jgi:hypothetical protein